MAEKPPTLSQLAARRATKPRFTRTSAPVAFRLACIVCRAPGPAFARVFDLEAQVASHHPYWRVFQRHRDGRLSWVCPACSSASTEAAPIVAVAAKSPRPEPSRGTPARNPSRPPPAVQASPEVYFVRRRSSG